jgi:hypothetical protein
MSICGPTVRRKGGRHARRRPRSTVRCLEEFVKYMLIHCVAESEELPEGGKPEAEGDLQAWLDEMEGRGVLETGDRLRPTSEATTVRLRNGEALVLDGPFAETKEQVAGFDIIDCADLDEAIEIASKHPCAGLGTVEVRPLWQQ